jgi:hypothetical protein
MALEALLRRSQEIFVRRCPEPTESIPLLQASFHYINFSSLLLKSLLQNFRAKILIALLIFQACALRPVCPSPLDMINIILYDKEHTSWNLCSFLSPSFTASCFSFSILSDTILAVSLCPSGTRRNESSYP